MDLTREIAKRRTFAIISHPDAGKTTLTEKLLLYGGAIHIAGAVKNNKIKRTTTSDFMEIEKQRGISVATSVMAFDYNGCRINILDTPGHKDFAEDTYRTLSAVDSVILVIDSVKGVEEQTRRLMEVCRMRHTPVMVFINKVDREGRDPFDLLEELETELNIAVSPQNWPVGMGNRFKGLYDITAGSIKLCGEGIIQQEKSVDINDELHSEEIRSVIGDSMLDSLAEEISMSDELFEKFELSLYRDGYLAPLFFGSALYNFGVEDLLRIFTEIAPPPGAVEATERVVMPDDKLFTGFVFKIHANLDPNHRDRIAFLRITSGRFERNKFYHHTRSGKRIRFASPTSFMANSKNIIDEAFPGDVIGLYDNDIFKIGDSLTEGENLHFKGVPNFSPEILKEVINLDPFRSKQLEKGIRQLTDEGVAQLFIQEQGNRKIVGTVGELQYDVIKFRLEHEYGAKVRFSPLAYRKTYWLTGTDKKELDSFIERKSMSIARDKENNPVLMAENEWVVNASRELAPSVKFHTTSEIG